MVGKNWTQAPGLQQEISKPIIIERIQLLNWENHTKSNWALVILTYNRILPDIKRLINKNWDIWKINRDFEEVFKELPIIAFRRNKNLHDIIGKKNNSEQQKNNQIKALVEMFIRILAIPKQVIYGVE